MGHPWNELRPAEADAWHHVFGDDGVVDIAPATGRAHRDTKQPAAGPAAFPTRSEREAAQPARRLPSLESLVNRARALADRPYRYRQQAVDELWRLAAEDQPSLRAAVAAIGDLLRLHSRRSASTADSEWLQLITAKRLLEAALEQEGTHSYL
jgi:hypothetical protein